MAVWKRVSLTIAAALSGALVACGADQGADASAEAADGPGGLLYAEARLINRAREAFGRAILVDGPNGLVITIELEGAPAGWHGVHLHDVGSCESADFSSAGGHFNPEAKAHGLLNVDGPKPANLANIYAHADGAVRAQLFAPGVRLLGAGGLLDGDGASIIVHENQDDHITQPIGGSGARIGCGVIAAAP
ncbi:MAG: superoxide dismutase family protein [Pseudomonadota bacterium]